MARVGVVGGTGPHGIGMALRLVIAGEEVVIGSRRLERAETAVPRIRERILPRLPAEHVRAADNAPAARTDPGGNPGSQDRPPSMRSPSTTGR